MRFYGKSDMELRAIYAEAVEQAERVDLAELATQWRAIADNQTAERLAAVKMEVAQAFA